MLISNDLCSINFIATLKIDFHSMFANRGKRDFNKMKFFRLVNWYESTLKLFDSKLPNLMKLKLKKALSKISKIFLKKKIILKNSDMNAFH